MKFFIVLAALCTVALAAPAPDHHDAVILKQDSDVQPEHYSYYVETSDGKSHKEEGQLKDAHSEHAAIVVHGTFSYKDEHDGHVYTVDYVADEHGFQPHGEHLPQLPAVHHGDHEEQHHHH